MTKHAVIKSFYASRQWVNFRLQLILERGNVCAHCNKIIPKSRDLIGHHTVELTPENVNDYSVSLNPDLVEIICFDCHNKEHKRFGYQKLRQVYLVYGPPLSGKTTFVRQQVMRGDLVVDMDALYSAMTLLPTYDKPDNLFTNVRFIHNQIVDNIKTRYGKWTNAWVIGGYADKYKRERMANDLNAELIFCEASKEECLQRLAMDEQRQYRQAEWQGYIDKWFEQYTQ